MSNKNYITASLQVLKHCNYPERDIAYHLYHSLLKQAMKSSDGKQHAITLSPPRLIRRSTKGDTNDYYDTYSANGIIHNFDHSKPPSVTLTGREVSNLMDKFYKEHRVMPTHLLLPPDIVFNEVVYYYKPMYLHEADVENPPIIEPSKLIVVTNAPMLAVALL